MSTPTATEHDSLIPKPSSPCKDLAGRLAPHDIRPSTRYGILAGIWVATFLSVRTGKCPWNVHNTDRDVP